MAGNDKCRSEGMKPIEASVSEFSAVRHERVTGCEFEGISCATYSEISRDAFLKYYGCSRMELKNVVLLTPLALKTENPQELRTVIKKESDHLEFIISSRAEQKGDSEENPQENAQWIKHAEGMMYKVFEEKSREHVLKELKNRCGRDRKTARINTATGISGAAGTWAYTAHTCMGDGEALIEFEIPEEVMEALKGRISHPCIADCIVDMAVRCMAGSGWNAVSYDSIKFYGDISHKTYAYIRKTGKADENGRETGYSIIMFDESENRIAEIRNYNIRYAKAGTNRYEGNPYTPYSAARRESPAEDIYMEPDAALNISGLSWRQMNCRDRIIAFLLGNKDTELIHYLKFFLGAKRGYRLKEYVPDETGNRTGDIFHSRILNRFGYSLNVTRVDTPEDFHTRVSSHIDKGEPVGFWMDEYHIFYTPFYLKSHTGHLAAINGYNRDNRLYAIMDHNHLQINNNSHLINYGQFYCKYETLESIYSGIDFENRIIITLDELPEGKAGIEELHKQYISVLGYLADSAQAGNEASTIYNSIRKDGSFNADSVDDLYIQLGGKELLMDTVLNHLCKKQGNTEFIKGLSHSIIQKSNMLVNRYINSLYMGKELPREKVADEVKIIQEDSVRLFGEILKQYA